jgi:hypothetical protein
VALEFRVDPREAALLAVAVVAETELETAAFHPAADSDQAAVRLAAADIAEVRRALPAVEVAQAWAAADLAEEEAAAEVAVEEAAGAEAVEEEEAAEVAGVRNHARGRTNETKIKYHDLNKNFPVQFCDRLRCRSQLDGGDRNEKGLVGNIATKTIQYPERSG